MILKSMNKKLYSQSAAAGAGFGPFLRQLQLKWSSK